MGSKYRIETSIKYFNNTVCKYTECPQVNFPFKTVLGKETSRDILVGFGLPSDIYDMKFVWSHFHCCHLAIAFKKQNFQQKSAD